jgi:hypothetical protein
LEQKIESKEFQYHFTNEELDEMKREIVKKINEKNDLEDSKKTVMAEMNAKVKGIEEGINSLTRQVTNGFIWKWAECKLSLNFENNKREWYDCKTSELICQEPLLPEDFQLSFKKEL